MVIIKEHLLDGSLDYWTDIKKRVSSYFLVQTRYVICYQQQLLLRENNLQDACCNSGIIPRYQNLTEVKVWLKCIVALDHVL